MEWMVFIIAILSLIVWIVGIIFYDKEHCFSEKNHFKNGNVGMWGAIIFIFNIFPLIIALTGGNLNDDGYTGIHGFIPVNVGGPIPAYMPY